MKNTEGWSQRNNATKRGTLDSAGLKRTDYRFCAECRTYKPKNKRPHVKGWKCTDCVMVAK